MADEKKTKPKENNLQLAVAAIVVLLVLAGAGYYLGYFGKTPGATPLPAPTMSDGSVHASKLLLSSMETESRLGDVHMKYADNEGQSAITYDIRKNSTDSWILETGDYGSLAGYIGQDNKSDVVCLTYMNRTKCAKTNDDANLLEVAARLKTRLPDPTTSLNNLDFSKKLIGVGALVFGNMVENATVNGFETEKIMYTLDYRNLTVNQLNAIGASPNDPSIYSISDWMVQNWIDKKSGILVKSSTTYVKGGILYSFAREFFELSSVADVPEKPSTIVSTTSFAQFYMDSEANYNERRICLASPESERGACLKNLAVSAGDPGTCGLIADAQERGLCMLIVAQTTKNAELCKQSGVFVDECYIAVVSETGDVELCKKLQNQSLLQNCYEAKFSGERIAAQLKEAADIVAAGRNCQNDSGCYVAGNSGQYCAPVTNMGPFANTSESEYISCLKGVQCGCVEEYCAFKKDESDNYTKCISAVETKLTEDFIKKIAAEAEAARAAANNTNNSVGAGANSTNASAG